MPRQKTIGEERRNTRQRIKFLRRGTKSVRGRKKRGEGLEEGEG